MRYYIVDNNGNVCGEAEDRKKIELLFDNFTEEEIEKGELEIIVEGDCYIVIDEPRNGSGDVWTKEFEDEHQAIEEAKDQWYHLTASERKNRRVYVLKSVNPDEEAPDHLDGDYVYECDKEDNNEN